MVVGFAAWTLENRQASEFGRRAAAGLSGYQRSPRSLLTVRRPENPGRHPRTAREPDRHLRLPRPPARQPLRGHGAGGEAPRPPARARLRRRAAPPAGAAGDDGLGPPRGQPRRPHRPRAVRRSPHARPARGGPRPRRPGRRPRGRPRRVRGRPRCAHRAGHRGRRLAAQPLRHRRHQRQRLHRRHRPRPGPRAGSGLRLGRVAIVGATGSVGTTVAKMVARHRDADELLLVARNERRLDSLRCNLSGRGVAVRSSTDLHAIRSADLVVLLTAAAGSRPRVRAPRARAPSSSMRRSRATPRPTLARERRDVRILDGGIVSIPSLEIRGGNVGLPNGRAYACFAETALLALSGHQGHFSIGIPDLDQVDAIRSLAREYAHLGFTVAAPTSFGVPVRVPDRVLTDDATASRRGGRGVNVRQRVVFIGGGYATLHAYQVLARRRRREIRRGRARARRHQRRRPPQLPRVHR